MDGEHGIMNGNVERVRKHLQAFDFHKLFIDELGWDRSPSTGFTVQVDGQDYTLQAVAQKRGMVAFLCPTPSGQMFPDYATRRKVDVKVRKSFHEHLIIFTDPGCTQQRWQWVRHETGKPSAGRELSFSKGQTGEILVQRLEALAFSLEEEEGLTIIDVNSRVRAGFDLERVTKRFYERFKAEHTAFLQFLRGIPDEDLQRWYVSVTLNRLMFVYFIQKKGFLDSDPSYLRSHLERMRQQWGEDHFYRDFLCPLFFDGFARKERSSEAQRLLGNVPYLNGGIFQRHQLEERFGQAIQIPDAAFTRLFDFFDGYNWHLNEQSNKDDNEIDPKVLGFIFEKYINQKQMGAYYTKEDITGYISKYTILPALFERARKDCRIAFEGESAVWKLLATDPERYIYPAMLKGLDLPLPENIAEGIEDVSKRTDWNRPAQEVFALPTEIWRETVARRQRTEEVRSHLRAGDVGEMNDLITDNLDIQQFAQDVIETSEGPELVRAIWKALTQIKILDPTCGSGAFLFAALNILEPLYEACLDRMQSFVDELDAAIAQGEKYRPEKFSDYRRILGQVAHHPNRSYYIYKSIIVQNLYGVDIMEEAVEICKLRLFLKLIAQVEQAEEIEPLPDIDFNVRAGNTLIGFTNREEVRKALTSRGQQGTLGLFGENEAIDRVEEQAGLADKAFQRFHQMQTEEGMDSAAFASAKAELRKRLSALNDELNHALALRYLPSPIVAEPYEKWLKAYQPFHWFVNFYGIMSSGGFDVVFGNPPWKEYTSIKGQYKVADYQTEVCGNLYGLCIERSLSFTARKGYLSFIVQLPLVSSSRMELVRRLLKQNSENLFVISFGDRPGKLFEGLEHSRSSIFISNLASKGMTKLAVTRYQRWPSETRPYLFDTILYSPVKEKLVVEDVFPKNVNSIDVTVFEKLAEVSTLKVANFVSKQPTNNFIFYQEATEYWVKAIVGLPFYSRNGKVGTPAHGRYLYFKDEITALIICAILNSSLFYAYFIANSDCFHLSDTLVSKFPVPKTVLQDQNLLSLCSRLMNDLQENASTQCIRTKLGEDISYAEFNGWKSKCEIDSIDMILAKHYGLTDQEIDHIINYEIKYRMGRGLFEEQA
jgi:hypothetical protein